MQSPKRSAIVFLPGMRQTNGEKAHESLSEFLVGLHARLLETHPGVSLQISKTDTQDDIDCRLLTVGVADRVHEIRIISYDHPATFSRIWQRRNFACRVLRSLVLAATFVGASARHWQKLQRRDPASTEERLVQGFGLYASVYVGLGFVVLATLVLVVAGSLKGGSLVVTLLVEALAVLFTKDVATWMFGHLMPVYLFLRSGLGQMDVASRFSVCTSHAREWAGEDGPFVIIGYSMGTFVALRSVDALPRGLRATAFYSIGAPVAFLEMLEPKGEDSNTRVDPIWPRLDSVVASFTSLWRNYFHPTDVYSTPIRSRCSDSPALTVRDEVSSRSFPKHWSREQHNGYWTDPVLLDHVCEDLSIASPGSVGEGGGVV